MKKIFFVLMAFALATGCGQSAGDAANTVAAQTPTPAATEAPAAESARPTAATAAATTAPAAAAASAEPILLAQADIDSIAAAGFVEGTHYRRLSPAQPVNTGPGEVEVAEFFMHSCIHCYNLEPFVEAWLRNKPDQISFVRVPTTWNDLVRLHAQAFYAAEALGKLEEIQMPMFREMHDRGNYLESVDKIRSFFGQHGISADDFNSVFNSFSVHNQVSRADELGRRYRVDSTPTIIVAGKYKTGNEAGSPEKLFELIELLAATELAR